MSEEQMSFLSSNNDKDKMLLFMKIVETEESFNKLKERYGNDFINHLHCCGCINRCELSSPMCGRGHTVKGKIQEFEKIN